MNCDQAQHELLLRLYNEQAEPELDAHLRGCGSCREALQAMGDVRRTYRAGAVDTLSTEQRERALALKSQARFIQPIAVAAAALLAIGVLTFAILSKRDATPPTAFVPQPPTLCSVTDYHHEIRNMINEVSERLHRMERRPPRRPVRRPSFYDRELRPIQNRLYELERRREIL